MSPWFGKQREAMSSSSLFGRVQRSGKLFLMDTEKPRDGPHARYVPKDCIGTLINFESQAKTESDSGFRLTQRTQAGLHAALPASRSRPRIERFRRIKEAFVPESRIR